MAKSTINADCYHFGIHSMDLPWSNGLQVISKKTSHRHLKFKIPPNHTHLSPATQILSIPNLGITLSTPLYKPEASPAPRAPPSQSPSPLIELLRLYPFSIHTDNLNLDHYHCSEITPLHCSQYKYDRYCYFVVNNLSVAHYCCQFKTQSP